MTTGAIGYSTTFPLAFDLPDEFCSINLMEDSSERAYRLHNQLRKSLPELPDKHLAHAILINQYMVEQMLSEGALYAATFVGRSDQDPTAATMAQFTVLMREAPTPREQPLEMVRDAVMQNRRNAETRYADLTIGRCLVVVEDDLLQIPLRITGEQDDKVRHIRQIQVIFPLTGRGQLVFFTLSTECVRDWDDYVTMMAGICKTIRWADRDNETASISNVLDG